MKFCGGSVFTEVAKAEMAEYIKRSANKQVADGFGGPVQARFVPARFQRKVSEFESLRSRAQLSSNSHVMPRIFASW